MTLKEMRQTRRAELLNVKRGTFKCEGEVNGHMLYYEQVFLIEETIINHSPNGSDTKKQKY